DSRAEVRGERDGAIESDRHDRAPGVKVKAFDRGEITFRIAPQGLRVVVKYVDWAELFFDCVGHLFDRLRIRNIGSNPDAFRAEAILKIICERACRRLVKIDNSD